MVNIHGSLKCNIDMKVLSVKPLWCHLQQKYGTFFLVTLELSCLINRLILFYVYYVCISVVRVYIYVLVMFQTAHTFYLQRFQYLGLYRSSS
jgi:hypothetical protein